MQWRKMPTHILLTARKRDADGKLITREDIDEELDVELDLDDFDYVTEERWFEVVGAVDQGARLGPIAPPRIVFLYVNDEGRLSAVDVTMPKVRWA